MIEFVNIADHQDESAGLPSISKVLQKYKGSILYLATRFLGQPFFQDFLKYRNQKGRLWDPIWGYQVASSTARAAGTEACAHFFSGKEKRIFDLTRQ